MTRIVNCPQCNSNIIIDIDKLSEAQFGVARSLRCSNCGLWDWAISDSTHSIVKIKFVKYNVTLMKDLSNKSCNDFSLV